MRTLILICASMMLVAAPVLADGPTTTPTAPQPTVLIFPFQPMGQVSGHDWIRPALQEDMVSELNKTGLVQTHSMPDPLVSSDAGKALAAGRDAGADLVVFGSYQIVGDQIRVNGQMMQVSTGNIVAPLQATGTVLDIFKIEDTLATQMQPTVSRLYAPQQNEPIVEYGVQPNPITSDNSAPLQSVVVQPPTVYYTQPSTVYVPTYPYGYNYGFYPSVYYGGGFFYGSRFDRGFTTFNHGFDHRQFHPIYGGRGFGGEHGRR